MKIVKEKERTKRKLIKNVHMYILLTQTRIVPVKIWTRLFVREDTPRQTKPRLDYS
jgi:hypothetical protein